MSKIDFDKHKTIGGTLDAYYKDLKMIITTYKPVKNGEKHRPNESGSMNAVP